MTDEIKKLIELSNMGLKNAEILENQINAFDLTMSEMLKTVPDENKIKIEEIKGLFVRVRTMGKTGRIEEAIELIKNFNNGC